MKLFNNQNTAELFLRQRRNKVQQLACFWQRCMHPTMTYIWRLFGTAQTGALRELFQDSVALTISLANGCKCGEYNTQLHATRVEIMAENFPV